MVEPIQLVRLMLRIERQAHLLGLLIRRDGPLATHARWPFLPAAVRIEIQEHLRIPPRRTNTRTKGIVASPCLARMSPIRNIPYCLTYD